MRDQQDNTARHESIQDAEQIDMLGGRLSAIARMGTRDDVVLSAESRKTPQIYLGNALETLDAGRELTFSVIQHMSAMAQCLYSGAN